MDGIALKKLALLSQLVAVSLIIPAPLMLVLGPFFLYMLSYAFLGKKWTALYVVVDLMLELPQYLVRLPAAASVAAPIIPAVTTSGPENPIIKSLVVFQLSHPYFLPLLALGDILVGSLASYLWLIRMWKIIRKIRARVPWS